MRQLQKVFFIGDIRLYHSLTASDLSGQRDGESQDCTDS
jgi:hypothetical protein